jgi:tetratricopeptide (TPR) repeat protein
VLAFLCLQLAGCNQNAHSHYLLAQEHQMAQEYGPALEEYEKSLALDPTSRMALFGKAVCLYKLQRYSEAQPLFEQFIKDTEPDRASFKAERYDAEFYRDKCMQEQGVEVPQNPCNVPEPPMGE